ncbi:MAG: transcriptional repressor [Bdellovibrionales bacterium]|nr:transcriptional repressor [Bdellovibrionales bacterium]
MNSFLLADIARYVERSCDLIRERGGRVTKSRVAIMELLAASPEPLSAAQIYERMEKSEQQLTLDRVSVYRTLETLQQLGVLHRVNPDGRYLACIHGDCCGMYHVMSHCTECHSVRELDVPKEVVAPLLFHMSNSLQFSPDEHLLHLDGVCKQCSLTETLN